MADVQSQDDRRLKIETALNKIEKGDPLLLSKLHGVEGISRPFSYEVTMLRPKEKPPISAGDLINTMAKISVKMAHREISKLPILKGTISDKEVGVSYIDRYGIFETLTFQGINDDDYRVYSGTVVPVLKMMDRQVAFRVFERMNVLRIVHSLLLNFPGLATFDRLLDGETFPDMEYCVQFRESTFNFISRLLARHGIWYYFDHDMKPWTNTMVLGRSSMSFPRVGISEGGLSAFELDEMYIAPGSAASSMQTISGFNELFVPTQRFQKAGDFNTLNPIDRIQGDDSLDDKRDLFAPGHSDTKGPREQPTATDRFRVEMFPVSATDNSQAKEIAKAARESVSAESITVLGNTRNIAFQIGRLFELRRGPVEFPASQAGSPDMINSFDQPQPNPGGPERSEGDYLIANIDFMAIEGAYSAKGFFGTLFSDLIDALDPNNSTSGVDALTGFTSSGLNNYLQNQIPYYYQKDWFPDIAPGQVAFAPYFLGGGIGAITAYLPALRKALADLFKPPLSDYSASFHAIPWSTKRAPAPQTLPLPRAITPTVSGPHSAVVVGPDGPKPHGQDVYADVLGRVRVRFPWDPGPPVSFDLKESRTDPYANANNTCWVRSSEGWAGRRYGTQFLPRIGEEVLVAFIDGDPDRPIIIGRSYNADRGPTNLPFPHSPDAYKTNLSAKDLIQATGIAHFPRSGIKTRSTPSTNASGGPNPNGFHLLRFDDTAGKEQLLLRSQNRMDMTVLGVKYESIGGDYHLTIGGIDANGKAGGDNIVKVFGDYHHHVGDGGASDGGNYYETVEKNMTLAVKKDIMISGKGALRADLKGAVSFDGSSIVLTATKKITLKVDGSWIVITPAGVFSNGPIVGDKSGGQPDGGTSIVTTDGPDPKPADSGDT